MVACSSLSILSVLNLKLLVVSVGNDLEIHVLCGEFSVFLIKINLFSTGI